MELIRVGGGIIFVILICALAVGSSEGNRWRLESFFGHGRGWASPEAKHDVAEQAWIRCRTEMMEMNGSVDDCDLCVPHEDIEEFESVLLNKGSIHRAFGVMSSQTKQTLMDCLRKNRLLFHESINEESYKHWLFKHLDLLLDWGNAPRRYLVSKPHRDGGKIRKSNRSREPSVAPAFAPGPAVAQPMYDEAVTYFVSRGNQQIANKSKFHRPLTAPSPPPTVAPGPAAASPMYDQAPSSAPLSKANQRKDNKRKFDHLRAPSLAPLFAPGAAVASPVYDPAPNSAPSYLETSAQAPSLAPDIAPGSTVASLTYGQTQSYSGLLSSLFLDQKSRAKGPEKTSLSPDSVDPLDSIETPASIEPPASDDPLPSDDSLPPSSEGKHSPPSPNVHPQHPSQKHAEKQMGPVTAPNVHPQPSSQKHDEKHMGPITAVAAAGSGVVVVALFLVFCRTRKVNKMDAIYGPRDEPLRKGSGISSSKVASFGSSNIKEFNCNSGNMPCPVNNVSSVNGNSDSSLAGAPASKAMAPIPPPPGKSVPPPPGPSMPHAAPSPPPPPPPKAVRVPPVPPKAGPGKPKPAPLAPHRRGNSNADDVDESGSQKTKLKPFFWDKVLANPDQSMVWHEIKSGSFVVDEESMESLFGYTTMNKSNGHKKESSIEPAIQYIQIIDTRKAQNLSILLRAHNVTTEEVCDALQKGNELPVELVQTLLKMAPTTEEELKLRLFTGDVVQLGPAERFLKVLVEIPFAFKRLECLLFMTSVQEDVDSTKESFATLEVACEKLRNSRLFLKLLEAILKTGNRMNDGTYRGGAQAFKLDTLLKLSDVKGRDSKTTLLHFVVQEIIRSEGIRALRTAKESRSFSSVKSDDFVEDSTNESEENYHKLGLEVISGVSDELVDVKKAAIIDADGLASTVSKLGNSMKKTREFLENELKSMDENCEFYTTLAKFLEGFEADITWLVEEEKRIMALVKNTVDYFHGSAGKDEGLRLFAIVREFLRMLDDLCKEIKRTSTKPVRNSKNQTPKPSALPETQRSPSDIAQKLFPQILDRQMDDSSSDDE